MIDHGYDWPTAMYYIPMARATPPRAMARSLPTAPRTPRYEQRRLAEAGWFKAKLAELARPAAPPTRPAPRWRTEIDLFRQRLAQLAHPTAPTRRTW